jgi:hypothetical protein
MAREGRTMMHWPEPTTEEPARETLMQWADDGRCRATDGCWLEQDAEACAHGYPSWAIVIDLAPKPSGD